MSENADANILADPNVAVPMGKKKDDGPAVAETAAPVEEKEDGEPLEEVKGQEPLEGKEIEEPVEEQKGEEPVEKKGEEPVEDTKVTDATEEQREADLLAELFPAEGANPGAVTVEEPDNVAPVETKKQKPTIASFFKKAEKRPLEERLAEAAAEKISGGGEETSASAAASHAPEKMPAKRAKKAMPPPDTEKAANQDIRTFFKKLPTKDEMYEEKRKVRDEERERQRQQEKKERDNFLYNKEKARIVPESFHSEKFRDVPMGSLLGDIELEKASSMKTVSMQEFLLKMAADKKREQDLRDGVLDVSDDPLPPVKKSRKKK
eukprot:GEMP01037578.1.p1 GENE.GEMP01037578.1~~GEMP01037578.1.p1  ORF type:complete len:321 (+),score=110.12 GEMP01037578.1:477-1439(+)